MAFYGRPPTLLGGRSDRRGAAPVGKDAEPQRILLPIQRPRAGGLEVEGGSISVLRGGQFTPGLGDGPGIERKQITARGQLPRDRRRRGVTAEAPMVPGSTAQ